MPLGRISQYRDLRVAITGGLGCIGSTLARKLVAAGAQVTIVDCLLPQFGGNRFNIHDIADQVQVQIADVRDEANLRNLVEKQDILFNLAGQTSHMDSMTDPYTDLDINVRAQLSVLEACRKFNPDIKIVFASTRQIYGRPDYLPVDERHLLHPVDVNGVNKMAGEHFHILYNNVYGIRATALRLTNTIGPGMRIKDARQTFLGVWIRALVEDRPFEVWGGEQLRDFTDVDDAASAFLLAGISDVANGQVYNVGGPGVISLTNLAERLVRLHGRGSYQVKTFPADRARIDIGDYYADDTAIRTTLGWSPAMTLDATLHRTLTYYGEHLRHYL